MDEARLRRIAAIALAAAEEKRETAGYAGLMHDNGGGALVNEVRAFLAGLDRRVPSTWAAYAQQEDEEHRSAERAKTDPDYATWVRLNNIYGYNKRQS